jgi:dephospho-CoA kinase
LDVYQQVPLRKKLTKTVRGKNAPVVVDSIRDVVDVDQRDVANKPVFIWFVDSAESTIRQRLADKSKLGEARLKTASPVDRTATTVHNRSNETIQNFGSLEDLRWNIDDALFRGLRLHL